jgi:FkbM family methyltransferase
MTDSPAPYLKAVEARHGRYLANPNDIFIGRSLLEFGEFSEIEVALLCSLVKPGATVVEVGANIGTHTIPLARKAGAKGRVHAFEPQPLIFQTLCANLMLNGITRVDAQNKACGGRRARVVIPDCDPAAPKNYGRFELTGLDETNPQDGVQVEVVPLDEVDLGPVDLIKVDAEGMEFDVLRGAARLIETDRPLLYVENDRQDRSARLIKLIQSFGYRLWWHCPPLFNPDNHAGKTENPWPGIVSVNMLCAHKSTAFTIDGAHEITDPAVHPGKGA